MKPYELCKFFVLLSFLRVSDASVQPEPPKPPKLPTHFSRTCSLRPKGNGRDDTTQILSAISECGRKGLIDFAPGTYNVTRKMTWDLHSSVVRMNHAWLSFVPDIQYWLNPDNTYRAIFIQNQASWFIVTGEDFMIDAGNTGGIQGSGQVWWNYYSDRPREDGDGRPVSLSLVQAHRGVVKGFRIEAQPFWCNAVSSSTDIVYDGMFCNATNTNPAFFGKNVVGNTDGIDTYRSDRIALINWDITGGDDCIAIKGNSSNVNITGATCRGGDGIAFGSLGQYAQFDDNVENVLIKDVQFLRLPSTVQPTMKNGVYFKAWSGSAHGSPPTGGGGAGGLVTNVLARNIKLDRVSNPMSLFQNYKGHPGDLPSKLKFRNLGFENWSGTSANATMVNIQCSPAAPCPNVTFSDFNVAPPANTTAKFICVNVVDVNGLPGPCTSS